MGMNESDFGRPIGMGDGIISPALPINTGLDVTPQEKKGFLDRISRVIKKRRLQEPTHPVSSPPSVSPHEEINMPETEETQTDHVNLTTDEESLLEPKVQEKEKKRVVIGEILHGSGSESPIKYRHMETIRKWRKTPGVAGHLYPRIQDAVEGEDEEFQRVSQWEYYRGNKKPDGEDANRKDSVFFMVNDINQEETGVGTFRARGYPWLQGRTGGIEQVIVPEGAQDQKIGTALAISMLDYAYYESADYPGGRSATRVKASTIVDRDAGDFHINELWLRRVGFDKDKGIEWVDEFPGVEGSPKIPVQPWVSTLESYEAHRADAVEHIRLKQPEYAAYLDKIWPELKKRLADRSTN